LSALEKIPAHDPGSVAFAAHAMSNFLTVSEGTVELILQHLAANSDAQLRVWLEAVQHATQLMKRTVRQLMGGSVPAETKLRFERVDLPLMVQRACNNYQRLALQKTIHIIFGVAVDVPAVWTDRVAIAAVLDNLLSNAVKYSDPGKQIWIDMWGEKGWAVCGVRDEGPGLSLEDQGRLFQKGVRLTPKPTGGEISTAFGLAVAKDLIDKLGGEIWCESVLGQGCRFLFRLPAYQEPAPISEPTESEPKAGSDGVA
jgi:signal transduction histidine kinase